MGKKFRELLSPSLHCPLQKPPTNHITAKISGLAHNSERATTSAVRTATSPEGLQHNDVDSTTPTTVIMGRLHSKGKGISSSTIPYSRSVPTWFKSTPETVVENICRLARKGATPSQIGVVLRDSHGVAQVKVVTGKLGNFLKNIGQKPIMEESRKS